MSRNWTPAGQPAGRIWRRAGCAAALLLLVVVACGGNDGDDSDFPVLQADITIDPPPAGDVVYLEKVSTSDNLITLNVMLNLTAAQAFDAFTLHFRFDPTLVNYASFTQNPETDDPLTFNPFGECGSGATYCANYPSGPPKCTTGMCDAPPLTAGNSCLVDGDCATPGTVGPLLCQVLGDPNTTGDLYIGITSNAASLCNAHPGGATGIKLLTVGFQAVTPTTGTRLELISSSQSGDCAILYLADGTGDLGISCTDGNATITAARR